MAATDQIDNEAVCTVHSETPIQFWCTKCGKKICMICFQQNHQGHPLDSYRDHLQSEVCAVLEKENQQSSGILDFSNSARRECEDKIAALEIILEQFKYLLNQLNECRREYEIYNSTECPEMLPFAEEAQTDIDFKLVEYFLQRQDSGANLENLAHKAMTIIEKDNRVEMKTDFCCFIGGSQHSGWHGGIEYSHRGNKFSLNIANRQTLAANSDLPVEITIGLQNEGCQASSEINNLTLSGEIIVEHPQIIYNRGDPKKIPFELRLGETQYVTQQKCLPIKYNCDENSQFVAKTELSKRWIRNSVTMCSFGVRCIVAFKLQKK